MSSEDRIAVMRSIITRSQSASGACWRRTIPYLFAILVWGDQSE